MPPTYDEMASQDALEMSSPKGLSSRTYALIISY